MKATLDKELYRGVSLAHREILTPKPEPHAVVDEVLGDTGGGSHVWML